MRKVFHISSIIPQIPKLQWGRTFSSAESSVTTRQTPADSWASMGPHFFKCGKRCLQGHATFSASGFNGAALFQVRKAANTTPRLIMGTDASMGPHFFKCGKLFQQDRADMRVHSFNGAALFQVRKESDRQFWRIRNQTASMGPHFFKCGKLYQRRENQTIRNCFNGAALFQVRKGRLPRQAEKALTSRFNGAALFQVRKAFSYGDDSIVPRWLQWGRTFSSAERRENKGEQSATPSLQWGRTFSSAESTIPHRLLGDGPNSFNGAALFQVRKEGNYGRRQKEHRLASMGPHFFKCGKPRSWRKRKANGAALQWGRTFSSAESRHQAAFSPRRGLLQWGRTFSSAESPKKKGNMTVTIIASMGPHFFKCGKSPSKPLRPTIFLKLQWGRTFSSAER